MVKLTIDGKAIEVTEGTTVLRAAEQAGVFIPTLCDHPELTPYGGCRLCLVEVDGFRTLQPSCTLPASNGMVVRTSTPKIHEARKLVLSLIFSERNHFCPYCQVSGGDCELQNNAYREDMTHWPIQPNWQPYEVDASNPFIILEHNRCILCRRCVRVCGELVGNFTLGFAERGAASILIADLGVPLGESTCVSCGMCVQVCPTGAIIDRSSAYLGLDKTVQRTDTICQECSVGCGISVVTRNDHIVRIEGNWDAEINHGLTCQAGRYDPLYDDRKRIETPLVRRDGKLLPVSWEETLQEAAAHIQKHGVTALASSRLSVEALNAFKQVFGSKAGLTGNHSLLSAELGAFEGPLSELDKADCFLVVGADLTEDHQVAGFMIKRAVQKGCGLIVVDSLENPFSALAEHAFDSGADIQAVLKGLAASLTSSINSDDEITRAARLLAKAGHVAVVFGERATSTETLQALVDLARKGGALDADHSAVIGTLGQANSLGVGLLGLAPMAQLSSQIYLALGDDCPAESLLDRIPEATSMIIQASYESELTDRAEIVLPAATWAEQGGHFISLDGSVQEAQAAIPAPQAVKSNAEILHLLAARLGVAVNDDWQAVVHAGKSPVTLHR